MLHEFFKAERVPGAASEAYIALLVVLTSSCLLESACCHLS